jgi:PAS domain S-box-containing protein
MATSEPSDPATVEPPMIDPAIVRRVADTAPDGVVVVDRAGLIRYWNHGMTRIFGFDAADVLGGPLDVIIPERLRKRHNDGFDAAVASGTTRYGDDDLLAVPAVAKDGRPLSIEFSIVLLPDADGGIAHVAAVIRDVTERWHRDREMKRRLRELEVT